MNKHGVARRITEKNIAVKTEKQFMLNYIDDAEEKAKELELYHQFMNQLVIVAKFDSTLLIRSDIDNAIPFFEILALGGKEE